MATPRKGSRDSVSGQIVLVGDEFEHAQSLNAVIRSADGTTEPAAIGSNGQITIEGKHAGTGATLELSGHDAGETRRFALDRVVDTLRDVGRFHLAREAWLPLFPLFECVSGKVTVCRPIWVDPWRLPSLQLAEQLRFRSFESVHADVVDPDLTDRLMVSPKINLNRISFPLPTRCQPVCQGKVDVYVRTCCCIDVLPPIDKIIIDLCQIIDCNPPIVPHRPWPEPGPEFAKVLQARVGPALSRSLGTTPPTEGDLDPETKVRFAQHLIEIVSRPDEASQIAYVKAVPELINFWCTCSVKHVSTTYLEDDGEFNTCFFSPPVRTNCTERVLYRVSQATAAGWQVVYDGLARNQSFGLDQDAHIAASWLARGCDGGPVLDPGQPPYVLLQAIGGSSPSRIIRAAEQIGHASFGPLGPADGLLNARPAGITDPTAGPYEQPWCDQLALLLRFDERLLQPPFNATKYRVRFAPIADSGAVNPASLQNLIDAPVWQRFNQNVSPLVVEPKEMFTSTPGVYRIPWQEPGYSWLQNQFHVTFNTQSLAGGRYVVILELMRDDETILRPNNIVPESPAPGGVALGFEYLRLVAPYQPNVTMNSVVVPHSALATVFHVNNRPVSADITDIVFNGLSSNVNCQFLSGRDCDTVALRYTATHDDGFQWYHRINYKQGLTGPTIPTSPAPDEVRGTNVVGGLSTARRFDEMLGSEVRCSFAANLAVYARHTNGFGRFLQFDRPDQAAFALETSGSTGCT